MTDPKNLAHAEPLSESMKRTSTLARAWAPDVAALEARLAAAEASAVRLTGESVDLRKFVQGVAEEFERYRSHGDDCPAAGCHREDGGDDEGTDDDCNCFLRLYVEAQRLCASTAAPCHHCTRPTLNRRDGRPECNDCTLERDPELSREPTDEEMDKMAETIRGLGKKAPPDAPKQKCDDDSCPEHDGPCVKPMSRERMTATPPAAPDALGELCAELALWEIESGAAIADAAHLRRARKLLDRADLDRTDARAAHAEEIAELRRKRIGDSEVIGRWMCQAQKAEADLAAARAEVEGLRKERAELLSQTNEYKSPSNALTFVANLLGARGADLMRDHPGYVQGEACRYLMHGAPGHHPQCSESGSTAHETALPFVAAVPVDLLAGVTKERDAALARAEKAEGEARAARAEVERLYAITQRDAAERAKRLDTAVTEAVKVQPSMVDEEKDNALTRAIESVQNLSILEDATRGIRVACGDIYRLLNEVRKDFASLRASLAAAQEREGKLLQAAHKYVTWHGPAHDYDCPGDDTCDCSGKVINDAIEAALSTAPAVPEAAPRPGESRHPIIAKVEALFFGDPELFDIFAHEIIGRMGPEQRKRLLAALAPAAEVPRE